MGLVIAVIIAPDWGDMGEAIVGVRRAVENSRCGEGDDEDCAYE